MADPLSQSILRQIQRQMLSGDRDWIDKNKMLKKSLIEIKSKLPLKSEMSA